ncbi:CvfD/Ygs/GSP13 family RNA-binding post-transcriptional regulator [Fundicoccus culcitae]|uniref:CvfD/Ygs/GSP13 family RNA-binding post-transcriptional regulator n=1 Tax=Fundicoccus culcitae TaxID=2969821 RepID=A0ABY5P6F1_9LACT|nr:CvfD/Ygs/GSP13 family RNA-binding post-transcriptional regulator [Fundicoccus culcitae]UUX34314.1 CvfD/Ygs/GSP13 family RNA-binding post-transcriptional regulator [Fundicoccus culcitae]
MKETFSIGDIVVGEVTGIQNYGVFVKLSDDEQGLIHISECKHGYMTNLDGFIELGQKVKVMIVDIDEYTKKISLSIRALMKLNDPPHAARIKKNRRKNLPNIGFTSIKKQLPNWIDEALEAIETDRYNQKNTI